MNIRYLIRAAITAFVCGVLYTPAAHARDYYVLPSGKDSNPGTQTAPLKTLQSAATRTVAGDRVIAGAGQYAGFVMGWDDDGTYGKINGTAANPITIMADPAATAGSVVIKSRNSKTPDGIDFEPGNSYVIIQGFTVNNGDGSISRAGIRVTGSDHISVIGNTADKNGTWGIFTSFSDYTLIQGNIASHSKTQHGVYVSNSSHHPTVIGNTLYGNSGCGLHLNGDISQGGDGLITDALVKGNLIYDNGASGGSAINGDGLNDSIIVNNLLYDNHASGISLFDEDAASGAKNNLVINNTIIMASDGRWAINIGDGSTGNHLLNNILLNLHSYHGSININTDSLSGFTSDHNIVEDRFSTDDGDSILTLAEWRSQTGQDQNSFTASAAAIFTNVSSNDYSLSAGSPAIDRAVANAAVSDDIASNPRPQGAANDIGAFEFGTPGGSGGGGSGGSGGGGTPPLSSHYSLRKLSLSRTSVRSRGTVTLTVWLNTSVTSADGSARVSVSSSSSVLHSMHGHTVAVRRSRRMGTLSFRVGAVRRRQTVTITATIGSSSKRIRLAVTR